MSEKSYVLAIDNVGHRQKTPGAAISTTVVAGEGHRLLLPLVHR